MNLPRLLLCLALSARLSARAEPEIRTLTLAEGVTLDLVHIPAGDYIRGSPDTEADRGADETRNEVRISRDFLLGKTAVTRGQWSVFARETGYRTEAETGSSGGYGWDGSQIIQRKDFTWRNPGFAQTDDHPVCLVTFPDAEAFCRWLARKVGYAISLPTEAQWEYACRAGTTTAWHGEQPDRIAWHKRNAINTTHPVDSTLPNAWGLHIGGNVAEWCLDWYAPYGPPGALAVDPLQTNPNLSDKPRRVLRGGSWAREPRNTRSAARYRSDPRSRNADIGFRIVCSVAPTTPLEPVSPAAAPAATVQQAVATPAEPAHRPAPINWQPPATVPLNRPTAGFSIFTVLIPLAVLFLVFRRLRRSLPAAPERPDGTQALTTAVLVAGAQSLLNAGRRGGATRVAEDGFWVRAEVPPGARIRYIWHGGGSVHPGEIRYQPGPEGHFVYTGQRPERVELLETGAADGFPGESAVIREEPARRARRERRGYPSAY